MAFLYFLSYYRSVTSHCILIFERRMPRVRLNSHHFELKASTGRATKDIYYQTQIQQIMRV